MRVRKQKAIHAARDLLHQMNVTTVPVPVTRIAQDLGIDVRAAKHDTDLSGFIYCEAGETIIGVNLSHSEKRQRFTIAHELGHYFLHSITGVHMDTAVQPRYRNEISSQGTNAEEIEANTFAAELLMPAYLIEQDMRHFDGVDISDDQEIGKLADRYGVSVQALTIRLANLGYLTLSL